MPHGGRADAQTWKISWTKTRKGRRRGRPCEAMGYAVSDAETCPGSGLRACPYQPLWPLEATRVAAGTADVAALMLWDTQAL